MGGGLLFHGLKEKQETLSAPSPGPLWWLGMSKRVISFGGWVVVEAISDIWLRLRLEQRFRQGNSREDGEMVCSVSRCSSINALEQAVEVVLYTVSSISTTLPWISRTASRILKTH